MKSNKTKKRKSGVNPNCNTKIINKVTKPFVSERMKRHKYRLLWRISEIYENQRSQA